MPKFAPILTFVKKHAFVCALAALVLLYLLLRLINLTLLPVFADEAIYIYWSQLTLSDWQQFLFYPLNDGKTPLFIWLMMPAIKLFANPLFAGRFVNVLFGLGQLYFTAKIVTLFTPRKRYQLLAAVAVIFCPGLILNNRLALMDTMSTFFVSGCFYFTYRSLQLAFAQKSWLQYCRRAWPSVLAATFFFGFGLLTILGERKTYHHGQRHQQSNYLVHFALHCYYLPVAVTVGYLTLIFTRARTPLLAIAQMMHLPLLTALTLPLLLTVATLASLL